MAIVVNNDLTRGLRGRIGKWFVFRVVRGKTIASRAPRKADPLKQSAAQRQTRNTFREAAAWAVRILLDQAKKQYYADLAKAQSLPNAYTAAVREYMRGVAAKRTDEQLDRSEQPNKETDKNEQRTPGPGMNQNVRRQILRSLKGIRFNQKETLKIGGDDVWQKHEDLIHFGNKDNFCHGEVVPSITRQQSKSGNKIPPRFMIRNFNKLQKIGDF